MSVKNCLNNNEFVIENYNSAKTFSSFLPGIAGLYGKPLWAFYVNRGQCMASFGTNNKDGAIMEFYPANVAYRRTQLEGFRTFIKIKDKAGKKVVYEPFKLSEENPSLQTLHILPYEMRIVEVSKKFSLKTEVIYFTVPGEDFPALARVVNVTNLSNKKRAIEIIDGMPKVCPFGMNQFFTKHMSRTIEAWMEVDGLSEGAPFYKLRVDAADVSKVDYITSGNFYLSTAGKKPSLIVDPSLVFGKFDDLVLAGKFLDKNFTIPKTQTCKNITPSAFSYVKTDIGGKGTTSLSSVMGYAESFAKLRRIKKKVNKKFFEEKRIQNKLEIEKVSSSVSVFSNSAEFDAYTNQTNLDNILRGGYPIDLEESGKTVYLFNRKHGDLERDYNNFVLRAELYSQGNGNFRDTNQNRRNSLWINPSLMEKDIKDFYNLIQLNGFNPLVIKGDVFSISDVGKRKKISKKYFNKKDQNSAEAFLKGEFTPGDLIEFAHKKHVTSKIQSFMRNALKNATSCIDAEHGEGYWIDHWTYNLDLVETYISVFPEKINDLLFNKREFMFFDDAHRVAPRKMRYVKDEDGNLRQYKAVFFDAKKDELIDSRKTHKNWVRKDDGEGQVYKTTLFTKLICLAVNKIASLDPEGRGVEMEADKPGWCDSLNGLPGILGSSTAETAETLRVVEFLKEKVTQSNLKSAILPTEILKFAKGITKELAKNTQDKTKKANHKYWNNVSLLKEAYRTSIRFGLKGKEEKISKENILNFLNLAKKKLKNAIKRSLNKDGIPQTFFVNEAKSFDKNNNVKEFKQKAVSLFLEGPVRHLKVEKDKKRAEKIYKCVKRSDLYDKKLGMYKINASIEKEPLEVGRSRVFTPGWLENESIWLHMEYKYLLEILKKGLYKEFYSDLHNALVPFQDPKRYGRSILENSSFIVSSKFFNEALHGTGFVARLSGATAEFLHILRIMNIGEYPFVLESGELVFKPQPHIHKDLFTKKPKEVTFVLERQQKKIKLAKDSYGFNIFRSTLILYHNPKRKHTFGKDAVKPVKFTVSYGNGKKTISKGSYLREPFSKDLREGKIAQISIDLG